VVVVPPATHVVGPRRAVVEVEAAVQVAIDADPRAGTERTQV